MGWTPVASPTILATSSTSITRGRSWRLLVSSSRMTQRLTVIRIAPARNEAAPKRA